MLESEKDQPLSESTARRFALDFCKGTAFAYFILKYGTPFLHEITDESDIRRSHEICETIKNEFKIKQVKLDGKVSESDKSLISAEPVSNFGLYDISNQLTEHYKSLTRYPRELFQSLNDAETPLSIVGGNKIMVKKNDGEWYLVGGTVVNNYTNGSSIVLSFDSYFFPLQKSYTRELLHHEFWHFISMSPKLREIKSLPNVSEELANIDNRFGIASHSYISYKDASNCSDSAPTGFAWCFGMNNPDEDGATIAEKLMTGNKKIWERSSTDPALMAKIDLVRLVYSNLSNGKMNDQFFKDLRDGRHPHWDWPILP